ncbi:MAG TPA: DUF1206 domain-containing protein [Aurantimonas sp.]
MADTHELAPDNRDWLRHAARAGYVARGAVFLIIGYFAFRAAFASGEAMDSKEAVGQIAGSSFGTILLGLLILALSSFAAWRIVQVVFDVDHHGTDTKGLFVRAGLIFSAFAYGALAFYAATLLIGIAGGGGGNGFVAKAYEAGYGVWLTYLIAAGMAAAGAAHIYKGAKAGFEKYMEIPEGVRGWLTPVCQFGLIARGVTFFILAGLLFTGAASYSEGQTPGLDTALAAIEGWSYGWALLSLTGLGLMAFGVYALAEALYRRINIEAVV